jgi:thymidylate synthase (FAD)
VHKLEKANHGAPMEHGAVYLHITRDVDYDEWLSPGPDYTKYDELLEFYSANQYSKVEERVCVNLKDHLYISTNYRVLFENNRLDDLQYLCEPTEYHHKRVTVKFTCNIGVSREFNRHRQDSINEESTRYCNYSKDKYGNEINVIVNNNKFNGRLDELDRKNRAEDIRSYCLQIVQGKDDSFNDIDYWLFSQMAAEFSYIGLTTKCDWKAQDARDVLPINTKSILVHSAFIDDWKHFFDLRAIGTTGAPHPQAKELAEPLMEEFKKRKLID